MPENYICMYKRADETDTSAKFEVRGNLVQNVEIFRTGVFRGELFEREYIEKFIKNFNDLKAKNIFVNVPVRKNHPDWFGLRNSMEEVIGYITDLRLRENGKITVGVVDESAVAGADGKMPRKNKKIDDIRLVADFEITEPDALGKIIRKTYRDRSIEWGTFPDNDGNEYDPVLYGVAFVDIPQVDKLATLFSKYSELNVDVAKIKINEKGVPMEIIKDKLEKASADLETKKVKKLDNADVKDTPPADDDSGKEVELDTGVTPVVDEVVEDTPKKDEEVVEDTPKKDDEVVEDTPKEEDEVIEDTPKEDEEIVEDTPKEDDADEGGKKDGKVNVASKDNELMELRQYKFESEMKSRVSDVENFASAGYSTPAMCELEKKLVKSFFALKDTESYLSPDKQFELFQQIKTSTPKVWEKKDGVVAVDDKELIQGLKKKDGVATGAEETADDYKGFAEKLVTAAGLSKDK